MIYIVVTDLFYFTPGTEWRTIRNIVNPGFRSNILSLFDDNFTYHTRAFVDRLEKYENSDEFDIFVPVHLCTIDLISGEFKPSSSIPEETPIILFVYRGYLVKNNGHPRTLTYERATACEMVTHRFLNNQHIFLLILMLICLA